MMENSTPTRVGPPHHFHIKRSRAHVPACQTTRRTLTQSKNNNFFTRGIDRKTDVRGRGRRVAQAPRLYKTPSSLSANAAGARRHDGPSAESSLKYKMGI